VGEDHDDTFPDTGHTPPHPRTATPRRDARANSQAEARARQTTRNAAWSWAAATRKAEQRRSEWAEQMAHARSLGTLPAILHDYVIEAAEQAGLTARDVPPEVWTAAGLPANTPTQ
jgi:TPP-dependent indolepyruvate ferredoxin oxidoreductase alpha subunit